jgi:polyferredoxin
MDLLRVPLLASAVRSGRLRTSAQLLLLAAAAVVVLHGLLGPQVGPRNLATVVTSIHWRGLLVIALLAAGNLFCAACPMILARDAGRRLVAPRLRWPRRLRGKWLALVLLALALFTYELFDLWELPRATAWLVVAYFGVALAVDLTFTGASFCKHVCPVGQFNFVASTMSPAELRVRDTATCRSCRTSDCIKGRYAGGEEWGRESFKEDRPRRLAQRGCELGLFLPMKVGNLDCTLCFDCVKACPHDNIALAARVPALEWLATGRRSGIGRVARRLDLAALALLFTFGAMVNAFAMTAPAATAEQWLAGTIGATTEAPALALLFLLGLVALPLGLLAAAHAADRALAATGQPRASPQQAGTLRSVIPFVYALVPLGASIWAAHYGFHLLTGVFTVVPVTQSAAVDLFGWAALGEPHWHWMGLRSGQVFPIQIGIVLLGAAGSVGLVRATMPDARTRATRTALPWLGLVLLIAAIGIWIFAQPMEMRGMSAMG